MWSQTLGCCRRHGQGPKGKTVVGLLSEGCLKSSRGVVGRAGSGVLEAVGCVMC